MPSYVISDFARIRRNEIVDIPENMNIHPDFLENVNADEFFSAFKTVHDLFKKIFTDIADNPLKFGLPVCTTDQYRMGGPIYNEARMAADWIFYLLLFIFSHGSIEDGKFIADISGFRQANKGAKAIIHTDVMLKALNEYGFAFAGLKEYKIPNNAKFFEITYPSNISVSAILHLAADKCYRFWDKHGFIRFRTWNYRLFIQASNEMKFDFEHVADSVHNKTEKEFAVAFHNLVMKNDIRCTPGWTHDGPRLHYHEGKDQFGYLFATAIDKDHVIFRMRIRDAEACMKYLEQCPESIKEIFRENHSGCEKRHNGTCVTSTSYVYEGEGKWRCGCWGAVFFAPLVIENIPHYIKLVELGKKKAAKNNSS